MRIVRLKAEQQCSSAGRDHEGGAQAQRQGQVSAKENAKTNPKGK